MLKDPRDKLLPSRRRGTRLAHPGGELELQQCTPGVDCETCPNQAAGGPTLPLCLVKAGGRAIVDHVYEGQRCRKRLADLGLAPGVEVSVLRAAYGAGPMIIAVRTDARLALGWGMANKIHVRVLD